MLDAGELCAVDAGLPALGDALAQAVNLFLDGVDRALRLRVGEGAGDVAEFAAQRVDRVLDTGAAQGFDLAGDVAKLFFEARQILDGSGTRT